MIRSGKSSLDTKKVCKEGVKVVVEFLAVVREDDMRESETHKQLQRS